MKNKKLISPWQRQPGLIIFLFCLFILFIRLFLRNQNLELDEAEQLVLAQQLSPGYPDQPPLYSWLQFLVFQIIGANLFSLALLKTGLLFGCIYTFHKICRRYCKSTTLAWCATVSWAFIPAISLDLIKDNTHSVMALLAACLSWYWLISPLKPNKIAWYLVFGCILGMGLLSKYNYLIFLFILISNALSIDSYRSRLLNKGMLLSLLTCLLITSPYYIWLIQHATIGLHSSYKLSPIGQQPFHGLTSLLKSVVYFILPPLFISYCFFPLRPESSIKNPANTLLLHYHLSCLPLLLILVPLSGLTNFETRWLIPIFFLVTLIPFYQLQDQKRFKRSSQLFIIIALITELIFLSILVIQGQNTHKIKNSFPFAELAQTILSKTKSIDLIVSDSHWLLGNLMNQLHKPIPILYLHPAINPLIPNKSVVFLWKNAPHPLWLNEIEQSSGLNTLEEVKDKKTLEVIAWWASKEESANKLQ